MKKFYNELEIEVVQISSQDICTLSGDDPIMGDEDWGV